MHRNSTIPRRNFLRSAALAGAALSATRCTHFQGAERTSDWRPRQCLSSVIFHSLPLKAFCAKAESLGFKGIDIWAPFWKCDHLEQARQMGAPAFRRLLRKHDLQVGAYTVYDSKHYKQRLTGYADFIGECGGGVVVFGTSFKEEDKKNVEASFPAYLRSLESQVKLARKNHVTIAIENHSWSIFNSLETFDMFHAHNPDTEIVGIALAPHHLQIGKIPVLDGIAACRGQMRFFYAWQDAKGTGQFPGIGPANFKPWLKALKEAGYSHWMTPFMHGDLSVHEMSHLVRASKTYLDSIPV